MRSRFDNQSVPPGCRLRMQVAAFWAIVLYQGNEVEWNECAAVEGTG